MGSAVGIIISEVEPNKDNRYVWFKPSTGEWRELDGGEGTEWVVSHTQPVGITGTKELGGYRFTFTKGILTGFEPV